VGISIERDTFPEEAYGQFEARLDRDLQALRELLARPGFGVGPTSIGAELESSIVDAEGAVLPVAERVLAGCDDGRLQSELLDFNVELNLSPVPAAGRPFSALEAELEEGLDLLGEACRAEGGELMPVGIVPTLRVADLRPERITDRPRYHALVKGVERLAVAPVQLDIRGPKEHLVMESDTVALEGSNTSHQLHLRVDPARYADTFNAAQLATPVALAMAANSPVFLGRALWEETRIPLFKQTFSAREQPNTGWRPPIRVPFGRGWVREGIYELLAEAVALHSPVLPALSDEDPLAVVRGGGVPELLELRLHQGTIWSWNRAVYDPGAGGHVRVELRALPAGPTPIDMTANAAFLLGLTLGLRDAMATLLPAFPFRFTEHNFYRAAQGGLGATLLWPTKRAPSPAERPVRELLDTLLPVADAGLAELGVEAEERRRYLDVIASRRDARTNGAAWLRRGLQRLDHGRSREDALARLTLTYLDRARTRQPVHSWSEAE
jgi:gamma-glutamyl:cysteine ligase YbdK (ATP-grasp superfamily)